MNKSENPTPAHSNDRHRQKVLGTRLKRLYADVVEEPVPDEFLSLLEQVDQKPKK